MAKGWMNTLKGYFLKLNQLHIEGDVGELNSFYQQCGDGNKECERILRGRELLFHRNAKPLKCKTIIRNIQILHEGRESVELLLHNSLWKLYQINQHFMEQEDEQYHRITLKEQSGDWYIAADYVIGKEGADRQPDEIENENSPDLNEAISLEQEHKVQGFYNRAKVKRYAELWWNRYNPVYPKFDVNCTNFVSQCLHAGGLPIEHSSQRGKGWWVQGKTNWSYSWSVAHSLMLYLTTSKTNGGPRGVVKETPAELMVGDVICYDWDGNGHFQHNTIVVAKDPNGMPLVNAHTTNSRHRYWEYRDSYAWTQQTKYKFIHIKG